MSSPKPRSPGYKNLKSKHIQSPVELKEKMRKNYKDKVQNCRNMLLNKFRGSVEETLRDALTEIYKDMFTYTDGFTIDDEEIELLEEIKNELVQEELQWWLQEYEKSHQENVDWSSIEQDNNVICLICQKINFTLQNNILSCDSCKIAIPTSKSLVDIKNTVTNVIDRHNSNCNNEVQFSVVPESNETHIYLICDSCMEMQGII